MEHLNAFTCELEDWFHILDSKVTPRMEEWPGPPLRAEKSVQRLLQLLEQYDVRATFFCLGWMAERVPELVRQCQQAGHEIASHGYGHVLAHKVGPRAFLEDIRRSKKILEDITGQEVIGFRSPGFSVRADNQWVFDVVFEAGYTYDASVFPAHHGHGGLRHANPHPHTIQTREGLLVEIPVSTVKLLGRRMCFFGGGYLRISPLALIRWGVGRLQHKGQPLIVYVHPREIDPNHPRLPLRRVRRFKSYVNLQSTMPKLKWLCENCTFTTMANVAAQVAGSAELQPARNLDRTRESKCRLAEAEIVHSTAIR